MDNQKMQDVENVFPFVSGLSSEDRKRFESSLQKRQFVRGTYLSSDRKGCLGLVGVTHGLVRAYITSESGREITLYRLHPGDLCLFTAKCAFNTLSFDIQLEALEDTEVFVVPSDVFAEITGRNVAAATYVNEIMTQRMDAVMWLMQQVLFNSFDQRLMDYLESECRSRNTNRLELTHDRIARDLGSAREVVSRMLKHFEEDGLIQLERGCITVL